MKKIFYLAIVFFAILLIQTKTFAKNIEENRAYFPPVIMYHDIRTEPLNFMDVTVENFANQLDFLQKDGWQTLSMDEFVKIIESKKIFPKKPRLGLRNCFPHCGHFKAESLTSALHSGHFINAMKKTS